MLKAPKTVLCIHSLPCFGHSGLSVVLPVLSAMGAQTVALPTVVLSTHTGGMGEPARMEDAAYGVGAIAHYASLGLSFDAIYSGFLPSTAQAQLVEQAYALWPSAYKIVDPVMGDHGRMYQGLSLDLVNTFRKLCGRADLLLPNATEAALLLNQAMPQGSTVAKEQAAAWAQALCGLCRNVLITGVAEGGRIFCMGAVRGAEPYRIEARRDPRLFPGTGDIFGAVLTGSLLQGKTIEEGAHDAADFVITCLRATPADADTRYGVYLESVLACLTKRSSA